MGVFLTLDESPGTVPRVLRVLGEYVILLDLKAFPCVRNGGGQAP